MKDLADARQEHREKLVQLEGRERRLQVRQERRRQPVRNEPVRQRRGLRREHPADCDELQVVHGLRQAEFPTQTGHVDANGSGRGF